MEIHPAGIYLDEYLRCDRVLHQYANWQQLSHAQLQAQYAQPAGPVAALAHLHPLYGSDWACHLFFTLHSIHY